MDEIPQLPHLWTHGNYSAVVRREIYSLGSLQAAAAQPIPALFGIQPDKRPFKTHVGIHFSHASGRDAQAPVFYLHLEPGNCFAKTGARHPDSSAPMRIRTAIAAQPVHWEKVGRRLELEGDSLVRPPRGFDPNHQFLKDPKRKDFVTSVGLTDGQVCGPRHMGDFVAACRTMRPLVEFTTRALGLQA